MKKTIFGLIIIMLSLSTTLSAQNNRIKKEDFNKTYIQISDSLPASWSAKTDTAFPYEVIIQSSIIDLEPDMTSNDPPQLKGPCEIYIMMETKVLPDSINFIRKRNIVLKDILPPQVSKDNLKDWYNKNEKILKLLDAEPTHYDENYSYRIKCRRLPKNEKDLIKYNQVIAYLNRRYKKY